MKSFKKIVDALKDLSVKITEGDERNGCATYYFDVKTNSLIIPESGIKNASRESLIKQYAAEYERMKAENEKKSIKNPWTLKISADIKELYDTNPEKARKQYPEVFYFFDGIVNTVISQSMHPAGIVASPITLADNYGVFQNDDRIILQIDMDCVHETGLVKYDILGLKNVEIIKDTYKLIGKPYPQSHEINWEDQAVWADMLRSPVGIFQFEGDFAFSMLKQYIPHSVFDMSLVTAAIRPSGASYRDDLIQHKPHKNPSTLIDDLLKDNNGYLCIEENQLIDTSRGLVPIKDVREGDMALTRNGYKRVSNAQKTGHKKTVKISYLGTSLLSTPEHKILTDSGWVECGRLNLGDVIAVRVGGCDGSEISNLNLSKIVGWLIGDGNVCTNNFTLTNRCKETVEDFKCAIESVYPDLTVTIRNIHSRANDLDLYRGTVVYKNHSKKEKKIVADFKQFYLKDKKSVDKFIPDFIMSGDKETILSFLGAYTDTDSCIKNDKKCIAMYKTASGALAYGLQNLTRKIGFIAGVRCDNGYYNVTINEARDYLKTLYGYSRKIRTIYNLEALHSTRVNPNNSISIDAAKGFFRDIGLKNIVRQCNVNLYRKRKYISIYSVREIARRFGVSIPEYLLNDNIKWVKVTDISDAKESDVYDLTVEEDHEFVCQGVIAHNCYQEDVIKFLQQICGMSGSDADNTRRAIGRKDHERLLKALPAIFEGYCSNSPQPREIAEVEAKTFLKIIEDASSYMFGFNHSVGYCMIGYLCAYLRYYHPYEFITAYLNNANGEADIKNGSDLALLYGIQIIPPKFGVSKDRYVFDKEKQVIAKGITSLKYLNAQVANELYDVAHKYQPKTFMEVLLRASQETSLKTNQRDNLIKVDFFSDFGNTVELARIVDFFVLLKEGTAKKISKDKAKDKLGELISRYSVGTNKDGSDSKSYAITDMGGLLAEGESIIKSLNLPDVDIRVKMANQQEIMGYIDLTTGRKEDRRKLLITEVYPLISKDKGTAWGYAVITRSLGTGKTARLTIRSYLYSRIPVQKGDIVFAKELDKNKAGYWYLLDYVKVYS